MAILDTAIATRSGARMRGAVCAQRPRHHESPSASASVSCCGSARFMMRCLACWSRPGEAGSASGNPDIPAHDHPDKAEINLLSIIDPEIVVPS
jgi:hypothetical protein